ncbi:protein kinase DC2-like [Lingula anatina]|uniref:Protein kinase DC2-like n=1 Tax=Lingula anatina TaxID=7574 RepID=A0A1S3KCU5_LINAN|nr:protein kinase DC2-like [Lingula anatina]|eukprot:XP_013420453.1 protein kinase DC2-like [Lingula anatina]
MNGFPGNKVLGVGSYGHVYKFSNNLALKVPVDIERAQAFEKEIVLLKELKSDFILSLHHSFEVKPGLPVVLTELCPLDLQRLTDYHGILESRSVKFITVSVCMALQFMRNRLLIHFDIKLNNILINRNGIPKVCDLGSAHRCDESGESSWGPRMVAYTITKNLAPEILMRTSASAQADYFALGVMIFELYVGRHPLWHAEPHGRAAIKVKILAGNILHADYAEPTFREFADNLICDKVKRVKDVTGILHLSWLADYHTNVFPIDCRSSPLLAFVQESFLKDMERVRCPPDTAHRRLTHITTQQVAALAPTSGTGENNCDLVPWGMPDDEVADNLLQWDIPNDEAGDSGIVAMEMHDIAKGGMMAMDMPCDDIEVEEDMPEWDAPVGDFDFDFSFEED